MVLPVVRFLARHPVKGFSAQALDRVRLVAGAHFPGDRLFAIENGPTGFEPAHPQHLPKFRFLCLMKTPRLAAFATHYDDATGVLSITRGGRLLAAGDLGSAEGREAIEVFCAAEFADDLRGAPKVLTAPDGFRFMDSARSGFVSLLNLASVRDIARLVGRDEVDPARFRMNIGIDGLPPWGEFDLIGKDIEIGQVRLRVLKATERCSATNVAPRRGISDLAVPQALLRAFGHVNCGVYAEVVEGGDICVGDPVRS